MRIWKGQRADLDTIVEFYKEAHQKLEQEKLDEWLAIPEEQPEGLYLMGEKDYPYLACVVWPWRKKMSIARVITTLEDDSADFSHYLKQFVSMFLHKFEFGDERPLFWFTGSDFVEKVALNAGFDVYTELMEYQKEDFRVPELGGAGLPLEIRFFQEEDLDQLLELERQIFMPEFWNDREIFRRMAKNKRGNFFVAALLGQVIGYIDSVLHPDGTGHLNRLGVHMDYQGLGVGKALLVEAIQWFEHQQASAILLNVRGENVGARVLYEKFGFAKTGSHYMLRYVGGGRS